MADKKQLKLIEIGDFPKTTTVAGTGDELIVVSKADGKTYGIKTSDFKDFLGTVQVTAPKPLKPTDPAPTLDGVYIPTVTQNEAGTPIVYSNAGGLSVNTAIEEDDYGMTVQFIKDGGEWVKSSYPLPNADIGLSKSITSNIFDIAFVDSIEENVILGVTKEGELFPRQKTNTDVLINQSTDAYEDRSMYYDVSKDGIWNQWIEPQAVVDNDGNLWFGSVGSKGNLYISCRYTDGRLVRRKIGEILTTQFESDDHNSPAILLDNRPEAEYPIIVFQCDHNTTPLRYWRFDTMNINEWDVASYSTVPGNIAYSEAWRYNDEIFVFSRSANGNRPWRMAYSSNNGNTWSSRVLFDLPAHWLYCLGKVKEDGSGVNIIMYGHPLNSLDQSIYFLELDFASGAVINPANRSTPVIANIRTAIANPSFVPLIVPNVALKIYEATGTEVTRMWDVSRDSTGDIAVVFNSSPSAARTMGNFNNSIYKVVRFSLSNGAIIGTYDLEDAGMPIENPKGGNMYFAGAALIDSNRAIISTWKNQSQIDGGNDVSQDYGKSEVRLIDFSSPLVLNKKLFAKSDLKLIRPYVSDDFILLNECKYFITYDNFYSNVVVTELENI